jgi:hypothetical protein
MIRLAEKANLRHACWQMGEAIAEMFSAVVRRAPRLAARPADDGPSWEVLSKRWQSG